MTERRTQYIDYAKLAKRVREIPDDCPKGNDVALVEGRDNTYWCSKPKTDNPVCATCPLDPNN